MTKELWFSNAQLITPRGLRRGAVKVSRGRIFRIQTHLPQHVDSVDLQGSFLAPGFIDLHVWGDVAKVSRSVAKQGTTAFLRTIGPDTFAHLKNTLTAPISEKPYPGARCIGFHFEGPYVNRDRCGALPSRWMRSPKKRELVELVKAGLGKLRLITIAPELSGALSAIELFAKNEVVVSLGHSTASAELAEEAARVGARAVTHIFNAMPTLDHKKPGLIDVAMNDNRVTAMVIADGVHVSPSALQILFKLKGPHRVALVTDSIALQGWDVIKKNKAFYTRRGVLAGSALTMMQAIENAVKLGKASIVEAVTMASETPARLLGIQNLVGSLQEGKRADLVAFDGNFRVRFTMVGGTFVYQQK